VTDPGDLPSQLLDDLNSDQPNNDGIIQTNSAPLPEETDLESDGSIGDAGPRNLDSDLDALFAEDETIGAILVDSR
jgi:hypothetical protein